MFHVEQMNNYGYLGLFTSDNVDYITYLITKSIDNE